MNQTNADKPALWYHQCITPPKYIEMFKIRTLKLLMLLSISLMTSYAIAEDEEFNWNVTVEIGLVENPSILVGAEQSVLVDFLAVNIWLEAYYKGFFIQTNRYRNSGDVGTTELGYEIHLADDYEIDFIYKSYLAGFDQNNAGTVADELIPELEGIDERKFAPSAGLRYLRYMDNAVAWIDVSYDLLSRYHQGWVVDLFYNRVYEIRNWDLSVGGGATFFSHKINDYYFGVDQNEINETRAVYEAGSGYRVELEASAQYPISQDWLFAIGTTYSHFSDSIDDSPIIARQNVLRFKMSVSYVF